jgi:hypothetical protein
MQKDNFVETELIDLRDLILMIKEKKDLNANLALEFDCKIEVSDLKPLVKIVNYVVNYISQLASDTMQIALNASMSGHVLVFMASSQATEFPVISEQLVDALKEYNATIELGGEPSKFVRLKMTFDH